MNGGPLVVHGLGFAGEIGYEPDRNAGRHSRIRDQGDRGRVGQNVRYFTVAIENVDRHKDQSQLHAGEIDVDHLDRIDEVDAEAFAGAESFAKQKLREAIAARIDFAEGERAAAEFERRDVAASFQGQVEEMAEVHGLTRKLSCGRVRYCGFVCVRCFLPQRAFCF